MSNMQFPAENEDRVAAQAEAEKRAKESLQRCVENGVRGAMVDTMKKPGVTRQAVPTADGQRRELINVVRAAERNQAPLKQEVLNNAEGLYRIMDAKHIEIQERHRLEEALCGRELTRQERRELKKIREEERMANNMVVFRTQLAEIYAVAIPTGMTYADCENNGKLRRWAIGFAVCMPEDKGQPRAARKVSGYRKARRRAVARIKSSGESNVASPLVDAPDETRVTPFLWKKAHELIARACYDNEQPWDILGLNEYHGDEADSRICRLFYKDGFASQFWERYGDENSQK